MYPAMTNTVRRFLSWDDALTIF
ncbi:hypothetical protein F01_420780 [Burkholderia cenocepacia]|nr:hypothetical protein F01_420780 [Burkholderia cenocepacia]